MMSEAEARAELCAIYRQIEQSGLSAGTAGNISLRYGENMLISPTGADGATISAEDFVLTTMDGEALSGGIPSSEWALHGGIYRAGKGNAVVHAHPDHCVALSCLREPIPAFHYMIASFGGDHVPCAPYAPFGTLELAEGVVASMAGITACLMANHGMVCVAESLAGAYRKAVKLEMLARQYWLARSLAPPVLLNAAEMAIVSEQYRWYGSSRLQP
jgi:L-fuculose-phosphate aldolase